MIVGRNMDKTWQEFATYAVIGIANSVIHWQLFFISRDAFELNQALSNFLAFCAAASFSFYADSLYTFGGNVSMARYLVFMAFDDSCAHRQCTQFKAPLAQGVNGLSYPQKRAPPATHD